MRDDGDSVLSSDMDIDDEQPEWLATQEILAESRGETKRFLWFALVPISLLIVTAGVLFFASRGDDDTASQTAGPSLQSESSEDSADQTETATAGSADQEDAAAGQSDDAADQGQQDSDERSTVTVLPSPPAESAYVDATLDNNVFVLSGRVPDEETKQLLEARAELAYAPFFSSQLEVDSSIEAAEWLAAAPEIVGLLPMITDGTIRLQDQAIALAGRSPNPDYAANFEGTLSAITGLPVSSNSIEITDLVPPRFVASVENGKVMLEGEIPSQAIGETFVQGAAAVYGADNVTSTMTVDEGTYTSFWMYTMPGIFQLFQPFPDYEIQVENGITSGEMQGGVLFELNSADISPEAGQVLGVGVALLVRDRSLEMTVVGHTDSQGPRDLNQELSLERAQSVLAFLVQNGVEESRLTAEGKGPDEPIASNDDEEGRALNRRVEFLFD